MEGMKAIYLNPKGIDIHTSDDIFSLGVSYRKMFNRLSAESIPQFDLPQGAPGAVPKEAVNLLMISFVCLSFSNELLLKAIIKKTMLQNARKVHKFNELFTDLDPILQANIKNDVGAGQDFDSKLLENSAAFETFRYFYGGKIAFDIEFLEKLNDSLTNRY